MERNISYFAEDEIIDFKMLYDRIAQYELQDKVSNHKAQYSFERLNIGLYSAI